MSELPPEVNPAEADDVPTETAPEPAQPTVDMQAHITLANQHTLAVKTAHETLAQRMENAYSIFAADLDRAYRIWEDGVKLIREGSSLIHPGGSSVPFTSSDPSRAV